MSAFQVPADWKWRPSPNHSPRGASVTAIVLHADAASKVESSLDWIRRAASGVSYHILIDRNGTVYAVVNPDRKAWHAGASAFLGAGDCNRYSVGVSLANRNDGEPFPDEQLDAAVEVCAILCQHYAIPVERITTHAVVATPAGRKTDPIGLDLPAFRDRGEAMG